MKLLSQLFFVLICFSTSCSGALAEVVSPRSGWTEVPNVSAIVVHAEESKKGVFMLDADETLFTTIAGEEGPTLVRLYDKLEELLGIIRGAGHEVYILTYNKADEIRMKLSKVGLLEKYFNGILSCEMTGDLMTAKGDLLRRHVAATETPYNFVVFIDNFPPFVADVQAVAKELKLPLHSYLCTGYIGLYHEYVYYHLSKLQQEGVAKKTDVTMHVERIAKSLAKYRIDISRFSEQYPTYESFKQFADEQKLIWPYLTYL